MGFVSELRRRHVVKVAIVYLTAGFAVLQGADLLLPSLDVPEWTFRLILALVLLGFPLALVLAWALEMTPAGIERTRPAPSGDAGSEETEPPSPEAPATAVDPEPAVPRPGADVPPDRSVAVLPFADLSPASDHEYFSDGITEEILSTLSKVRGLDVISRTSVMRFKGSDRGVREIARELDVAHVVEGSVRAAGQRLRITAQLIDARTDRHLWSETYDRDLDDVFAIQSDVAGRIVDALKVAITPAERARLEARPTDDVEAYQWFLKGRQLLERRTGDSLQRAIDAFDRAIERDPDFALAWAHRGDAHALLPSYARAPVEESVAEARRSARKALEIDPDLGEAHATLGTAAQAAWEWEEADRRLRRAMELAPGYAPALQWHALTLLDRGRFDAAIEEMERARELDPLSPARHMGLGAAYRVAGRYEEAERTYRRGLEIEPGNAGLHINLASLYETTGRYEEAIAVIEEAERRWPGALPTGLTDRLRTGWTEGGEAGYWESLLEASAGDSAEDLADRGFALAQLGRLDEAIETAGRMIEERKLFAPALLRDPKFAPARSHPGFPALMKRLGLE